MKVQIENLDQLEDFILDDALSPKSKFIVFREALQGYGILIISFPNDVRMQYLDSRAIETMTKIIGSIKENPSKVWHGTLLVRWKDPNAKAILGKK